MAPGWENSNLTGKKSKTFVRGILKKNSKLAQIEMQETRDKLHSVSAADVPDESADGYGWVQKAWEDLSVGDFVKILNNQQVPADIVICSTSEEENVAYVETKNLDGETNLKSRNAVPTLTELRSARACSDPKLAAFAIHAPSPDENMYRLNGNVAPINEAIRPQPIDLQTVLLRGSVIRNTDWVIGVVLFTGLDTKIVMNSSGAPSKRSKVEKGMNPQVFVTFTQQLPSIYMVNRLINLALLLVMAVACAIAESIIDNQFFKRGAPWTLDENIPSQSPSINGLSTWANALITFQNVVPISLYISIEAVRSLQAAFIYFDSDLLYSKTDTATLARNWNLSDDLGQIEYIFSDKTGTLTQVSFLVQE
jgi:phospholipid-translocating ATPase